MQLDLVLTVEKVRELLRQFTPIRIHLTPTDEDRRWVELEQPSEVTLVPGRGVRAVCSGRLRYELGGMGVPLSIRRVQVLLEPVVTADQEQLEFHLSIEDADLQNVPDVIDRALVGKINESLTPQALHLAWGYRKSLTRAVRLPERLEPLHELLVSAQRLQVTISDSEVRLMLDLGLALSRTKPRPTDD